MGIERVLVVDDDPLNREFVAEILRSNGCESICAGGAEEAWKQFREVLPDLVFTDLRMPGAASSKAGSEGEEALLAGIQLLERIHRVSPQTPAVVMTAYASIQTAIEAMRHGAADYLIKPFTPDQIEILLMRFRERHALLAENEYLRSSSLSADALSDEDPVGNGQRLVTADPLMKRVCQDAIRVAASKASVLIQGETGTGKELIARLVHQHSPRSHMPFIRVNCAALAEGLLESEIFGHEKGAFTGAVTKREGRMELAHRGTLLLDEISEIRPPLQAKLLRAIEEEEFERVGGTRTLQVDVRIIATTNRDLREEVRKARFREDLYYRLNVVPITLPPLRQRTGDIEPLVEHFLDRYARQNGRPKPQVSPEAIALLRAYGWPGNVRELRNVIHRLVVLSDWAGPGERPSADARGPVLLPQHLRCHLIEDQAETDRSAPVPAVGASVWAPTFALDAHQESVGTHVGQSLAEAEQHLILATLESTNGNRARAARVLKVTSRTLRNKLKTYRDLGQLPSRGPAESPAGQGSPVLG